MEAFSYLSVLTSIVLALGITRIFSGLAAILEQRGKVSVYWVHLLWALNVFLFIVLQWWILFRWREQNEWNYFLFGFLLLSPTISFLLAAMLFPTSSPQTDFKSHFYSNRGWFFGLAALLPPLDAADTLLKGYEHFKAQGTVYPVFLCIVFALTVTGAMVKREWYHRFFSVFFFAYLLAFIFINLNALA